MKGCSVYIASKNCTGCSGEDEAVRISDMETCWSGISLCGWSCVLLGCTQVEKFKYVDMWFTNNWWTVNSVSRTLAMGVERSWLSRWAKLGIYHSALFLNHDQEMWTTTEGTRPSMKRTHVDKFQIRISLLVIFGVPGDISRVGVIQIADCGSRRWETSWSTSRLIKWLALMEEDKGEDGVKSGVGSFRHHPRPAAVWFRGKCTAGRWGRATQLDGDC